MASGTLPHLSCLLIGVMLFMTGSFKVSGAGTQQSSASTTKTFQELVPDFQVEKVAEGFKFTEGPVWSWKDKALYFSDIPNNRIMKWTEGEGVSVLLEPTGKSNGLAIDREDRLVACESEGRRVSVLEIGENGSLQLKTLVDSYHGKRLNSPNDLCFTRGGILYFTDPSFAKKGTADLDLDFFGVYRLTPDGQLHLENSDLKAPNGIALSPDENHLYVNVSRENEIWVWDIGAEDGSLSNKRKLVSLNHEGAKGTSDGMKVDQEGNIYATGPGGISVVRPDGTILGVVSVPEQPANVCWGDEDGKSLYITAKKSVYRLRVAVPGFAPHFSRKNDPVSH
jgi:sugar lactone lactonase YvrE